jgi:transposase-like protein
VATDEIIRIKVRDEGAVTTKTAHRVICVDANGRKHALGCWTPSRWAAVEAVQRVSAHTSGRSGRGH